MITKSQWDDVCSYVYSAKLMGLQPFFMGRRVREVDIDKKEIVVIKQGELPIRYKRPESSRSLSYVLSLVSFKNITLKQIMEYSKSEEK